ncbi:hypothetical protein A2164_04335 [Candidatus Curtissbacteria bacterium RBG_13_35_7]|uniref:Uncharacterized protein n=1 Tax=Candidatus Curtissbacteria bacterium RBG_13_35_7 TaxID=1797705 RepID=A0A1F5G5X5_9BACT|nr:MAG: hypothetical protein A2164_04335 [Candidatus Curtissbacteria bacterium RBG_13_35_7]
MIFIVIGIIILVVSFFIALSSLVKEQKNVNQDDSDNGNLGNKFETGIEQGVEDAMQPEKIIEPKTGASNLNVNRGSLDTRHTDIKDGEIGSSDWTHFPWEDKNKIKENVDMDMGEDNIEVKRIRDELERITSQKAQQDQQTSQVQQGGQLINSNQEDKIIDADNPLKGEFRVKDLGNNNS